MKFSLHVAASLVLGSGFALATPIKRAANSSSISSTQILQFALTLEHLENTFYTEALAKFDEPAFEKAGYAPWVRGRFEEIAEHEASHVALLTQTLGNNSISPCNYSFPFSDPKSFATLSNMLESVGNGAYISGSQYLVNDTASLRAAGAILSMEARHASWVKSSVLLNQPWSSSYDIPLDGNLVYSLASTFIIQCPASNPPLPFKPFPSLNISAADANDSMPMPGQMVNLTYVNSTISGSGQYLAFLHGLNTTFTNITNSQAIIPPELQGLVFAVVTSDNAIVSDSTIVAGPAPLTFDFDANVPNY
ncbi:hypothetical protein ACEPAI_4095 [Sanghuangporus weigelae]